MDITDDAGRLADPVADSPERAELRAALRALIAREAPPARIRQLDEAEEFDDHLYATLDELGVLGIDAPAALGGAGDVRDQLVVIEELAAGPTSMAAFMIVQYMIIQVLGAFASTDEQRAILADLVAARTKVSFSLSEPDGGTDIARIMKTRAERDGAGGWRLNGHKMWTSGATRAQWLIVLARTGEATRSAIDGVSMLLVPTDAKGVEIRPIDTLGIHGLSTCEVFFDDVALGGDALIGAENAGFRQAFRTLNREGIIACAASLGVGRGALEFLTDYTRERQVFGKAIGSFQVPQHWMVDAAVHLEAARSLMVRAAEVELGGGRADMLALMAKLMASEAAQDITLKGMQLMGGFGYSRELPMQRWFRDVRLWSFAPLNNEMVRNRIGERLLGLPRSY
ncbi:MAG: acyl-CoA dehydrogenase family protein [Acidimicrobiales bacterium]